jgi:GT2 family glycosyltransferase
VFNVSHPPWIRNDERKLTVFSALIILHEAHASRNSEISEHFERIHHTKHLTNLVIKSREEMTGLETPFQACIRAASPFMTTLLYQMATANLRRCKNIAINDSVKALLVMKAALKDFDGRWRASGE